MYATHINTMCSLWIDATFAPPGPKYAPKPEIMAPIPYPSVKLVAGDSAFHSTLSRGESIGLAFRTESGLISSISASVILILIFVSLERSRINISALKLSSAPGVQGPLARDGSLRGRCKRTCND